MLQVSKIFQKEAFTYKEMLYQGIWILTKHQNMSIGGESMNHELTCPPIPKLTECFQNPMMDFQMPYRSFFIYLKLNFL